MTLFSGDRRNRVQTEDFPLGIVVGTDHNENVVNYPPLNAAERQAVTDLVDRWQYGNEHTPVAAHLGHEVVALAEYPPAFLSK